MTSRTGSRQERGGFTLLELLTVVTIIAILAGLMIPVIGAVKKKAKITETRSRIDTLATAMRAYKDDTTEYPVEDDVDNPTESFYYQLIYRGMNAPYVVKTIPHHVASTTSLRVKDSWWNAAKANHIRYFRGPQRNAFTSEADFKTNGLALFFGNDMTFNLWSFGPNMVDDSSDAATGTYDKAGGDENTDPSDPLGVKDDITNWNPNTLSK